MNDPAKKPGKQPESYQPKKPEMMKLLEEAQGQTEAQGASQAVPTAKGGGKRKIIKKAVFPEGNGATWFPSCFASVWMRMEGMTSRQ